MALEVRYVGTRVARQLARTAELQRVQHRRERVPQRVPAGAGQSAGQHRGRAAATRSPSPARRHGAAADPFLAFFNGRGSAQRRRVRAALHRGQLDQPTFLDFLAAPNPNPFGFASRTRTHDGPARQRDVPRQRGGRRAAGRTSSSPIPNLLGGANVHDQHRQDQYNSLQMELRRRLSQAVCSSRAAMCSGKAYRQSTFPTFRRARSSCGATPAPTATSPTRSRPTWSTSCRSAAAGASAATPTASLDRVIGGWQLGISTRIQSGRLVDLGNVRLVGMTARDVQQMFKLRFDDAGKRSTCCPQDVIDNTILAFNVSATSPTGYCRRSADRPVLRAGKRARLHRAGQRLTAYRRLRRPLAGR